ncbi:hypothetical protein AWRI1631_72080 [Saccharomyces cerevisiae AWRI1631]|jgi:hypothetical protein|uniref:Uncharacterized protein n=1 Tax=Saccharomyces cerevisiae (strain AWRI1631) TaxID=545124 RepID=B5VIT1_YEAS6|nr:hypothetical protein AWRI1631_72080 [Saccharomyces cerevisiae AWRI1631]
MVKALRRFLSEKLIRKKQQQIFTTGWTRKVGKSKQKKEKRIVVLG